MEQKTEETRQPVREPYTKPELKLLGDVLELTRGAAGSRDDFAGGRQFGG